MEQKIRNAAKALIIRDNKMLAIKISDGHEEWYILPGGGQGTKELLPDTVCREVAEELGLQIEVKDLVFVIEGLHGESFHRVDLVFLCKYIGKIENAVLQADTNQVGYAWLDIKTLNTAPLYPSKLRRQIMNLFEGKAFFTTLEQTVEELTKCFLLEFGENKDLSFGRCKKMKSFTELYDGLSNIE